MFRFPVRPIALGLALLAAGCSSSTHIPGLYRLDIRQGNYIDQAQVERLQPGMTRQQVQALLGTPLIADPFHQNRWDYYYAFRPAGGTAVEERSLTLFFEGDILSRVMQGPAKQP
ncbi:MAG TPA: outer membrane protein assembly factor BamE [Candidatus Competibacteraceae bacterium]|nr:outer membrane protein assembly factor BamE [Candidatus Competibacteraceae bacterium]